MSHTRSIPLLALALLPAALALNRPPTRLGEPLGCARAQLIDGHLRCDAEIFDDLRRSCGRTGDAPTGPARPLAAGDEVVGACTVAPLVRRMAPDSLAALEQGVDVNTASIEELASLPGVGPTIAARIVAGRPYAEIDALLEIRGIGPKRLVGLRRRARVVHPSGP